jgi:hypothetical protein
VGEEVVARCWGEEEMFMLQISKQEGLRLL